MTIQTRSKFYYDFQINKDQYKLAFNEGGPLLRASLNVKRYAMSELATEVARAMTDVGGQEYSCTVDRVTRVFTISAPSNFTLKFTDSDADANQVIGFSDVDLTGSNSYSGDFAAGKEFIPQFKLQDFIDFSDNQEASSASVQKSASGKVEVVSFGLDEFASLNIQYQTDQTMPNGAPIESNPNGVSDLRNFMIYAITKGNFEFIPDRDAPGNYSKVILERSATNQQGVGFRLKELYGRGLPGYFESGRIILRKIS